MSGCPAYWLGGARVGIDCGKGEGVMIIVDLTTTGCVVDYCPNCGFAVYRAGDWSHPFAAAMSSAPQAGGEQ